MDDNVDFYRRFIVELPDARTLAVFGAVLGVVFGIGSTWVLSPASSIQLNILGAAVVSLFFYVLPAAVSTGVLLGVGQITRRWAVLVSIVDMIVVFLFSVTILFTDAAAESWQVLWLGLATLYVTNILMVLMARGQDKLHWNLLYALIFPAAVLLSFHVFIGRIVGIPRLLYLRNSVFLVISAFLLMLTFRLYDFIIRANVTGISAMDFTSVLIMSEQRALDTDVTVDVRHQALRVENDSGALTYNIPWLHPGPVEGFGGGRMTEELITDDTFFLHIPCDHTLDLADPADIDRFKELPAAETHDTATALHCIERDGFTVRGRRYGNDNIIVYVQNRAVDDYSPSIAKEIADQYDGTITIVDQHNQPLAPDNDRVQALDRRAKTVKQAIKTLVQELQDAETHPYEAGFAGDSEYQALVERVNGEETVLLGIDGNDAPPVLYEVEEVLQDEFDQVLVHTTDSHKRLVELATPRNYDKERLLDAARRARETVSPAAAGIGERTVTDVPVLGDGYSELIFTLNVMGRLIPVSLLLYYLGLVFLVL